MSISARIERVLGLSPPVAVYVAIMSAAAASTAALLAESGVGIGSKAGVAGLTAVAVFGERGRITLRPKMTVSISLLPAIFAAVLYGPLAAMIVFGSSVFGLSFPLAGRISYLASRAITGAAAAGAAAAVTHALGTGVGEILAASTAAATVA